MAEAKLHTISEVEEAVGLPRTTLRYYEKEFPSFLKIRKTPGGHRRYSDYNIEQFKYLKREIHEKEKSLKDIKESLAADTDPRQMRKDIDLLLKVSEELVRENGKLKAAINQLGVRLGKIEEGKGGKKKGLFNWFE